MSTRSIKPRKNGADIKKLTEQQQVFVKECLADDQFNITEAARKAGYKNPSVAANKLVKQVSIARILGKAMRERMERLEITADRVLQELAVIGFADPGDLFSNDGSMLNVKDMPEALRRSLASVDVSERTDQEGNVMVSTKVRFSPKIQALELIARHLGMLNDKVKLEHDLGPDLLTQLLDKVEGERERRTMIIDDSTIDGKLALGNGHSGNGNGNGKA